jgi:RNA polymerase sigma-70 factor, ECF subfamily
MTTHIASLSPDVVQSRGALQWLRADAQRAADVDLIKRIVGREGEAMRALFARHNVKTYRFVLRLAGDETLAEDLVSEVFIDVWRNAACFDGRSQVSTWILAIARFKTLAALRRRKTDQLDEAAAEQLPDLADDPETAVQKNDRLAILRRCMSHLSRDHREIIDLVYFHEKSIDDVAQIVGAPQSTVKTRMFYARKRLRDLLRQSGIDNSSH